MRESKFRGKHDGEWVYGNLVKTPYGLYIIPQNLISNSLPQFSIDPKTVGQFIGFTDKNGREIYGRDLVEDENGIGEVEWVQEHCSYLVFTRNPSQYHRLESDGQLSRTAVIGNAIDNPELLEV
ncbi:hypothetical protein P40081_15180 [Paenibacillus sp. FSL P4-0081]|uniref:YopX family protein n=1 Tax=Paenibacillus sp. FSL P4-0081 TaxID=1536769 RepID=UPI0004F71B9C|nr:YopX family protein [Paenibacillus sp. FSL P4-0081]AIQ29342.1 hypothetical protein P40081_15180 [Paenibacillus sp. FSL P4-0081]